MPPVYSAHLAQGNARLTCSIFLLDTVRLRILVDFFEHVSHTPT